MPLHDRAYLTKRIWASWRGKGLAEEDLYTLISFRFKGKERMHDLTDEEMMELATVAANWQVPVFTRDPQKQLLMTPLQLSKLTHQLSDLGWSQKKFFSWIHAYHMVPHWDGAVESIHPDEARGIIAALERIRTNQRMKKYRQRGTP